MRNGTGNDKEHWVYFFWKSVKNYPERVFLRLSVSVVSCQWYSNIHIFRFQGGILYSIAKKCSVIITNPVFSRNRHKKYWCFLQDIGIESFIWFDYDYEERTSYHDIIILKLKSPALILNDKVQPVRLPPSKFFAEHSIDDCIISGWGAPEPGMFI